VPHSKRSNCPKFRKVAPAPTWPPSCLKVPDAPMVKKFRIAILALSLIACAQPPSAKSNPRGVDHYEQFRRAQQHAKKGEFAEAAAVYDHLAQTDPDDVEIWNALGSARSKAKQFRGAAEAYSQALARGGEYPGSFAYRIAGLYEQAGDKSQSLAWRNDDAFRKVAGLLPMTISTRYHQTDDQDQRTWIAPKIPVQLSSEDYFANRDPVLDAVLNVIERR